MESRQAVRCGWNGGLRADCQNRRALWREEKFCIMERCTGAGPYSIVWKISATLDMSEGYGIGWRYAAA